MNLESITFRFKLLTPCFSGTALGKHGDAEMRVPPIRGHIRFWHRVLFGADDCNRVWGCASGKQGSASKVAVRLLGDGKVSSQEYDILPHKSKKSGSGSAISPGQEFEFELQRLVGCAEPEWEKARKAAKLWLLLGSLGLRSNRAAGSVWPMESWTPKTKDELAKTLINLGLKKYSVALIGENSEERYEELRAIASNTIRDSDTTRDSDTIRDKAHSHIFGSMSPRKPSPTKFKVIELNNGLCLLALAPQEVILGSDGNKKLILEEAEKLLNNKPNSKRWRDLGKWDYIVK
ncbi:MAG: RAMP superfamily CRISPR-associated protein [Verrucomicrobiia bacterium]